MTTRKRNEFLDPVSSDNEQDDEPGYDSEAAEETKGRTMKKRRMDASREFLGSDDDDDDREDSDDEDAKLSRAKGQAKSTKGRLSRNDEDEDDDEDMDEDMDEDEDETETRGDRYLDTTITKEEPGSKKTKPLKSKPLDKTKPPKKNKTGVIYFSSLPPYLRPFALKSMLEARGFSPITRVFLTPETPSSGAPRRRSNKRKTYSDGWVEFASKKTAKICAETLNASVVGGKKGGWYHDDVWNMRYLHGFKWDDLMEQVQRERSEREARQRIEDTRARKEEKVFVSGVEKGKVLEGMERKNEEKRNRKKQQEQQQNEEKKASQATEKQEGPKTIRRTFKQNEVKVPRDRIKGDAAKAALGDDAKRVLGKIF